MQLLVKGLPQSPVLLQQLIDINMPCRVLAEEIELVIDKNFDNYFGIFWFKSNFQASSIVETPSDCKDVQKSKEECLMKVNTEH